MYKASMIAAIVTLAGAPAMADLMGIWETPKLDDGRYGHIEIAPCGDSVCGTVIRGWDEKGREGDAETMKGLLGENVLWDMKPDGANEWSGGKLWAYDRDKTYNGKLELQGDNLIVSGCVLVFCRDQTWTRVE